MKIRTPGSYFKSKGHTVVKTECCKEGFVDMSDEGKETKSCGQDSGQDSGLFRAYLLVKRSLEA